MCALLDAKERRSFPLLSLSQESLFLDKKNKMKRKKIKRTDERRKEEERQNKKKKNLHDGISSDVLFRRMKRNDRRKGTNLSPAERCDLEAELDFSFS